MEFLVRFETNLPADMPGDEKALLKTGERARALELREQGILRRLWRVPGRRAVVGLWEASDATAIHDALASLPQFPWMDVTVEPLATHPQELP
ncbi:muconolactone Delta-isomerase [Glutamicibacter creatinolyticus]|uniref:muconolactone Delta-isomerase n=1 Tax=Glutamicibacter creatinolyticus TaxID=162496 RepID=UPI0037BF6891